MLINYRKYSFSFFKLSGEFWNFDLSVPKIADRVAATLFLRLSKLETTTGLT